MPTHRALPFVLVAALVAGARVAVAQPAPRDPAALREAQQRFERGVHLSDERNFDGALVEFRRAYELSGNALLLFNISIAHEAIGRYVDAMDDLREYQRRAPAALLAARRAVITASLARLRDRIGTLVLGFALDGLEARVDERVVPVAQLRAGLPLSVGQHHVVLSAPYYENLELRVDVPSGTTQTLTEVPRRLASSVFVETNVPAVSVQIDGHPVPFRPGDPLPVPAGRHTVTVRRAGYVPFTRDVEAIGAGAHVDARLEWSTRIAPGTASRLTVLSNELGPSALLDGHPVSIYGTDVLPPGPHRLRLESPNYFAFETDVQLAPGQTTRRRVLLVPTPEFRSRTLMTASAQRVTGIVATAVGLTSIGAGLLLLYVGAVAPALHDGSGNCPVIDPGCAFGNGVGLDVIGGAAALLGLILTPIGLVNWGTAPSTRRFDWLLTTPQVSLGAGGVTARF